MQGIEELLDQSIAAVPFTIGEKAAATSICRRSTSKR
jgi:hypothetical protein